jgi:hypothetical protein
MRTLRFSVPGGHFRERPPSPESNLSVDTPWQSLGTGVYPDNRATMHAGRRGAQIQVSGGGCLIVAKLGK